MNAKDLLDIVIMEGLDKQTEQMRRVIVKEEIKNLRSQDNFSGLNRLDQEGSLKDYNQEANETNEIEETEQTKD